MNKYKYVGLVVLTTFIMGIAFPVGKIGMDYAPPFFLMGLRYVLAGGLLALIAARKPQPRGMKQWGRAAVIGLFQSAGVMGCVYYSMRWVTSSESAIITFMNPLLVIVLGTLFTGASYRRRQWLGVLAGFIGVVLTFGLHFEFRPGLLICFAGAVCFAAATLLIKRWGAAFDMTVLAAYQMAAGGIALLLLSTMTERPHFEMTVTSVAVLVWLVVICSIVQFTVWFYLLQSGDPAKTSSFLFLAPLFGVLTSWLLLGENIRWYVGLGGAWIAFGIFLVNWEVRSTSRILPQRPAK
ncbi:EamA family transporter [Paenibacillus doosanensis]|uniref:Inner membrane transporter yiJE n=1 Tax=Paenibacillus konkukensis TaxID=2020716 RepID=A0ABY4RG59_9BACL|nr:MULTISPECIES: EamA family transporter [Paenibacillus]MCS7461948.1 EamA family transporter [Paenibacillus doosanensis]UQZ81459.1 putative inner membrane transporter yiJE [Paenibacillus konkukensis]